jgi:hypothetical protein
MPKPEIPQSGTNAEDRNLAAARQTLWHSDFGLLSDLGFRSSGFVPDFVIVDRMARAL